MLREYLGSYIGLKSCDICYTIWEQFNQKSNDLSKAWETPVICNFRCALLLLSVY